MIVQRKPRMTVDAFLVWVAGRPGRYERVDGGVFAMSPQTARHVRTKYRLHARSVAAAGLDCEAMADGMPVRVDAGTDFEPDGLVRCGGRIADDALAASAPVRVVEVLSPGTGTVDTGRKLEGYVRVPSLMHDLIVDPARPKVIHHRRADDAAIEAHILSSGVLDLDPPGARIAVADLLAEP